MKNNYKIGLLLNFDFIKGDYKIIYNWLHFGFERDITNKLQVYYFVILFIGLTLSIEK